ncbi:hypothetical protein I302_105290 [Kwoniella bestiolae CBS 10118]|uniref:Uncharacterized protein n=1 Tax=Kwoniella bestiolae CBS 10118 TaxID=1296100 RepID=A0A1B9FSP7_9TREE|nr:hypothetical protein I302_08578 [Kwoniella bestiolae CBS 10118]OCF21799.1 hypothetical protein I302_08578 [Kwoniella bestiolae CBS 10118]
MLHTYSAGTQLSRTALRRTIHACSRRAAQEPSTTGKGKAISETLFAPSTRTPSSSHTVPSTSKPSIPTYTSTHSRAWQAFESSWSYTPCSPSPSAKLPKFIKTTHENGTSMSTGTGMIVETRTIFEKPINFSPLSRLLGAGFAAFIGFQWFWIPSPEEGYQTFWDAKPGTGVGTKIWGTFKHFLFFQTPYWALGGAAMGIWSLTKKLNIVTKLEQCRVKSSSLPAGQGEVWLRMSTVKKDLMKGLSKEPRDLKMDDVRVLPLKGLHERNGEYILNLHIKDSTKGKRITDGQPYIVDTRYGKYLDKSDSPYVLSPSRLRHVFGRWEGYD